MIQEKMTEFTKGLKTADALYFAMAMKYPNDKEFGLIVRTFLLERMKDNPFHEEISDLAKEISDDFKNTKSIKVTK
tara:strand:+ start:208 stop:435 length:228 start_codon:yes stop_codon:yes gene_type:complete